MALPGVSYVVTDKGATNCRFKGTSGAAERTLEFSDSGTCKVEATSVLTGHKPWSKEVSVTVGKATQSSVTWTPTTSGALLGTAFLLDAVSGFDASANVAYVVSDKGTTDCRFKGTSGDAERTLEFSDVGTCKVTATSVLTGYNTWSKEVSIIVSGEQTGLDWVPPEMTKTAAVGTDFVLPQPTGVHAEASVEYTIVDQGTTNCVFKGDTGDDVRTLIFTTVGTILRCL